MKIISTSLAGGLGNYLFQTAIAYSKSLDDNLNFIVDENDVAVVHNKIDTYKNNIFRKINFNTLNNFNFNFYTEREFKYNELPKFTESVKLLGYFQSEKYFLHNRNKILDFYSIDDNSNEKIIDKYGKILTENTCSIHVRRGDYLKLPNHHPVCTLDYYNEAIKQFPEETVFLVFSDDIEWCKNVFKGKNYIFIEGNQDYVDLWLMSLCKNNIIANSSFSWWGGWLNQNVDKKIIAPNKWFGSAINHDTKDLIPQTWQKINL